MTQLANDEDISRVVDAGLTDRETIEEFAAKLREHHALLLSRKGGATQNFPLVFKVWDFGLPVTGETRSQ